MLRHAVGAAALVALLPEAQYLAGAVNDDNLAWLAGALLVLAGLWYGYPLVVALNRREAPGRRDQVKASGQRS